MNALKYWALVLLVMSQAVQGLPQYPFDRPQQKLQFERLTHRFRCMVCQNEDLAASTSTLAATFKAQIAHKIRLGQTDAMITNYLVHRYSDYILLDPPIDYRTWVLWLLPVALLIGGVLFIWWVTRPVSREK